MEKIVLVVTGEFPPEMDVEQFAVAAAALQLQQFGDDRVMSAHGGIPLHVLRTDVISDETSWLEPLLQEQLYAAESRRFLAFLTSPPLELRPPLGQLIACFVPPQLPDGDHPGRG